MARTIGMGMDYSPSSKAAARWAVDNLVKAGDRIVLIHVLPKGADASHKELWKSTGPPLIPLLEFMDMNVQTRYGVNPDKEVMEILQAASKSKQVEVLAKIYWGDAREKLCEAVDDLKVDSFVLGCRGLGTLKRTLLGSVSNYIVNNAACPVTVVRGPTRSSV
ncbi:universal stress protein PHOS32-like [Phragmites australis]|uniref:universal stress protein PHOS32-like n=1 Tax=Phragmites australis TaxID=29695 RepID=UPI002D77D881|nr:universal stress protein PHOS32-like [Phragmites australis]